MIYLFARGDIVTETALFTFLHILVFVYWLGGDLGAFYASRFLIKPDVPPHNRLFAAKIISDVDMAPRTALILAAPTGLLLAISKGWIALPYSWGWAALALSLLWLALAWHLHVTHGQAKTAFRRLDQLIRWGLVLGLGGGGLIALSKGGLPLFLAVKCLLLAGAVLIGLAIRSVLRPLGPSLAALPNDTSGIAEASLATTLRRARPLVILIWLLIATAAMMGLWTPA